jgi:hypothetical protein
MTIVYKLGVRLRLISCDASHAKRLPGTLHGVLSTAMPAFFTLFPAATR